jgi:S-adenosylmethionine:tRNA ribosyltransferase-isomerase
MKRIVCRTKILITPGYRPGLVRGLITNFHQPQSTLLLLVAALMGDDWKKMYSYALEHDFRFLSYGDGCIIKS